MTAMLLVNGQGGNSELTAGARDYLAPIASHFGPDITWATFGEISNLSIAQAIARHCRVPWIMDIKDNWEIYVPAPLRGIVARRFRDAAAMTSNAAFHCRIAERAHNMPGHLIYSGVGEEMIAPAEAPRNEAKFRITITGGIYSTDLLADLLSGIQKWLLTRPQQEHGAIELSYAGNANRQFEAVAREVGLSCPTTIRDHLPLADLARMCQAASVNCYVWNRRTFHHKLLELLACSRPVITYPGESAESVELAREVGGRLITCDSAARLGEALDGVWHDWRSGRSLTSQVDTRAFSWDAAADKLEALMLDVLARRCSPTARHRAASGRAARE